MGMLDNLGMALSGGGMQQQQPQINQEQIAALLQRLGAGGGNNSGDYGQLLKAFAPAPQKKDFLSDFGAALQQSAMKNPQAGNFNTLGLALNEYKNRGAAQEAADTDKSQKSLSDILKMAEGNRGFGLEQSKLAEIIRNNKSDEVYKQGMLGVHRQNANNEQYSPLGMDEEGNAVLFDKRSGNIMNAGKVNLGKGKGGMKTSISAADQGKINDAFDTIIGAKGIDRKPVSGISPLDPELKKQLSAEAAQLMLAGEAVSADDAALKVMNKYGGVKSLQEQTEPGMLWGKNNTGFRRFDKGMPNGNSRPSGNDPLGLRGDQ